MAILDNSVSSKPRIRAWAANRFDTQGEEPLGPLANLLDLTLVFACGLIAALISLSKNVDSHFDQTTTMKSEQRIVEQGRELPEMPSHGEAAGQGYESVGQVFRDPKTGKLILIGK